MWSILKTDEIISTSKSEVSVTKMTASEILVETVLPKQISWKVRKSSGMLKEKWKQGYLTAKGFW
jgi:hypothetical protein